MGFHLQPDASPAQVYLEYPSNEAHVQVTALDELRRNCPLYDYSAETWEPRQSLMLPLPSEINLKIKLEGTTHGVLGFWGFGVLG